jgi:hypothetical protein
MTARDSQATAICARLALFGGDSEGVGSSMMPLESHGTKDVCVAIDPDHHDVVRGRSTQAKAYRELDPRRHPHTQHALFGVISYPPREWGSIRCTATLSAFPHTAKHKWLLLSFWDRPDHDDLFTPR